MNRKLFLALMLASGMAFAQTGGTGSTPDQQQQQQPSQQPTSPSTDQSSQPSTATADQQASMKGCLKQSGGNWVLAADNGQSVNLQGDSSMLKPHDGHQVQVSGTRTSDGSLQVSSVNMISDSCTSNQAASTDTGAAAGAAAAGSQAADKTAEAAKSAADTATAAQANPPSTQSTPDQSQQPATTTAPGAAPDQTTAAAPADQSAKAGQKLPQTASPLPLLGLLGFGSMATGLIGRKKK